MSESARWYVVHTYSGYENAVKTTIEKAIVNRKMQDQILEVSIPMQDVIEIKNGVQQLVQKKMFPAYVLVHMIMNEDTWYVVRNTRGVTGFVGPGSKPVPLTEAELMNMGLIAGKTESLYAVGDQVVVTTGVWEDTVGVVKAVNEGKQSVTISIDMFGRETPVELGYTEIKKI
jgi:transcriptional antiterminator NusG